MDMLEKLVKLKPDCYMGYRTPNGIIVGPLKEFNPETNTLTFNKSVFIENFHYKIEKKYNGPRTIKMENPEENVKLGKYLVYSVGGQDKISEVLDQFGVQLTTNEWKEYKAKLKVQKAAEKAEKRAAAEIARKKGYVESEFAVTQVKDKFFDSVKNIKQYFADKIKEKSKEPASEILYEIKHGIKYISSGWNPWGENFEEEFKDYHGAWLHPSTSTNTLFWVNYPLSFEIVNAGSDLNSNLIMGLDITYMFSPHITSLVSGGIKTLKNHKAKQMQKARIVRAICPLNKGLESVLD